MPELQEKAVITQPGRTAEMAEKPKDEMSDYEGRGLLADRKALITGGDSGIGRAVAVAFAKEGAHVAIAYLEEDADAQRTCDLVEEQGGHSLAVRGDLTDPAQCRAAVESAVDRFGAIDVLVNNAAYQCVVEDFTDIADEQWRRTFATNIDSFFHVTKSAVPHMPKGSSIINTASINGLRGHKSLVDYSATKGAVLAFTYSLSQNLAERGIRVNAVAPGPVWTPLIPASMPIERPEDFGQNVPYGRAAQPDEIAPSYVFFASSKLSSYYSGEVLAPIGGETLPG